MILIIFCSGDPSIILSIHIHIYSSFFAGKIGRRSSIQKWRVSAGWPLLRIKSKNSETCSFDFSTVSRKQAINFYTSALEQNAINGTNPKHTLLSNRSAAYCSLKMYDKALDDAISCISCTPSFAKVINLVFEARVRLPDTLPLRVIRVKRLLCAVKAM
jgi:hypothetical protein